MTAFLNSLRIMLAIFPAVIELVKAIENAAPVGGLGSAKLELLTGIISDLWSALDEATRKELRLDALVSAAVSIANRIVALFNGAGLWGFGKKPDPSLRSG